jgi:hypothetical protein
MKEIYYTPILAAFPGYILYEYLQKFSQAKIKKNKVRKFFRNGHFFCPEKCPKVKSTDGFL